MKNIRKILATAVALLLLAGCTSTNKVEVTQKPAAFWPSYPDEPRIQFLTSFKQSTDVEPTKNSLDNLIYGKEPQQSLDIAKPYGVAMTNGRIYVCDERRACVTILDLRKHQTLIMRASNGQQLQHPSAITIASDGLKYVADVGADAIFVFDKDDRHLTTFAYKGTRPVGVATFENELYIADFQGQRVLAVDRFNGNQLRTIGGPGSDPGQFTKPLGLAADDKGFIYVCDVFNCQLQKFDRNGKLVGNFGTMSTHAGGLIRPKQIAVDHDGTIYIVDALFANVQLFDQTGRCLTYFGSAGNHPGAMFLPAGFAICNGDLDLFKQYIHPAFQAERLILVTNNFGDNKVSVYALGHLKPGETVQAIVASRGIVASGIAKPTTQPGIFAREVSATEEPVRK